MTNINARLRALTPGVRLHNASDVEQVLLFNSEPTVFPPHETIEVRGQDRIPVDEYFRPDEAAMEAGLSEANPRATAGIMAAHFLSIGKEKGIVLDTGQETDGAEFLAAKKRWVNPKLFWLSQ